MASDRFRLDRQNTLLLVIDVQEKLIPSMPAEHWPGVLETQKFLVAGARALDIPVLTTEQYPRGLGHTIPELADACREAVVEKESFGCCGEPRFLTALAAHGRSQVLVAGMEAHVCVYQTVLGLLAAGYQVHLLRDAVISRDPRDAANAIELARAAGAVVSTAETSVFQLLGSSRAPGFKAISALVKARFAKG